MGWVENRPARAQEPQVDLYKAIRTLYDEKKRVDKLISSIEQLKARGVDRAHPVIRIRRGRRRMTAAERIEVSRRMKRYWLARRQQPGSESASDAAPAATPYLHF
jgi:23S rRNA maturation-related 3'-5' exoribonuclease YhaM